MTNSEKKKYWCDGCTDNPRGFLDLKSMKKHVQRCHRLYVLCPRSTCAMVYPRSMRTGHLHEKRYYKKNRGKIIETVIADAEIEQCSESDHECDSAINHQSMIQESSLIERAGSEREPIIDVLTTSETEDHETSLSSAVILPSAGIRPATDSPPSTESDSNTQDSDGSSFWLGLAVITSVAILIAIRISGWSLFKP